MSLERFLVIDSLPKIYQKPVWREEKQKCCVFCSSPSNYYHNEDYYYDIVRRWYEVSEKAKYPRNEEPAKCPHDEWLTDYSIDMANLLEESIKTNEYNLNGEGFAFVDANPFFAQQVLKVLAEPDIMEFVILYHVEYRRTPLAEQIKQEIASSQIAITFEQFEEINEVGVKKLEQLEKNEITQKQLYKELYDYVRVFDTKVDDVKFSRVIEILNIFVKRERKNYLCNQTIEMLRQLSEYIKSLDCTKYEKSQCGSGERFPQWQHNLHFCKQERERFDLWLEKTEKRLGRKAPVIDLIGKQTQSFES